MDERNRDLVGMLAGAEDQHPDPVIERPQPVGEFRRGDHWPVLAHRRPGRGCPAARTRIALAPGLDGLLADEPARRLGALAEVQAGDDVRAGHAHPGIGLIGAIGASDLGNVLCAEHDADPLRPADIEQRREVGEPFKLGEFIEEEPSPTTRVFFHRGGGGLRGNQANDARQPGIG